jgi:predicted HicB family RNase H-like nuclease
MANKESRTRKIHIVLSEDVHKLLKVKCALQEVTIQEYVSDLLKTSVEDVVIEQHGKKAIIQKK